MTRSEILEKACQCVCEDRNQQYEHPEDSFGKIAELWSAYRGERYSKRDVAMMMALLKIARIYAGESIDSYVDLAGYAACGGEIASEKGLETRERVDTGENQELSENQKSSESQKPSENQKPKGAKHPEIHKIPYRHGKHIIENGKEQAPREKFYFTNGKAWIGVDNSTGDLWVEEFITEEGCIAWLEGDFTAEDMEVSK